MMLATIPASRPSSDRTLLIWNLLLHGLLLMNATPAVGLVIAPAALDHAALAVHIFWPHPVRQRVVGPVLAPAFRRDIEISVDAEELLAAASERGVGVKDLPGVVPEEDAVPGAVLERRGYVFIVVVGAARRDLVGRERDVEVVVELGVVRRHPRKTPPHPLADDLDRAERRAGHGDVGHVVVLQMHERPLDLIDLEGASDTLTDLTGSHHEVLHEQLAASLEEIGQGHLALGRIE